MFRTSYEARVGEHTETVRKLSHGTARICSARFGAAWKGLFPFKAAEELAARTGCSVRTASYQLSGEHEPSARAIAALVNEIVKRD
jgi:transcriptional regulator with XRE-family HTH domain